MWTNFFLVAKCIWSKKVHFKKCTFPIFDHFFTPTSSDIFSVICLCRMLIFVPKSLILLSIFMWAKNFGGPKDFLSKKMDFKNALFRIFHQFLRLISNDYFSVICLCRKLIFLPKTQNGCGRRPQMGAKGPKALRRS